MNIYTIRDNLLRTIAGKEAYLEEVRKAREENGYGPGDLARDAALFATYSMLKINLDELYGILNDVQECCKKATADSWLKNPDRSGGQFTQEEVDNANKW